MLYISTLLKKYIICACPFLIISVSIFPGCAVKRGNSGGGSCADGCCCRGCCCCYNSGGWRSASCHGGGHTAAQNRSPDRQLTLRCLLVVDHWRGRGHGSAATVKQRQRPKALLLTQRRLGERHQVEAFAAVAIGLEVSPHPGSSYPNCSILLLWVGGGGSSGTKTVVYLLSNF